MNKPKVLPNGQKNGVMELSDDRVSAVSGGSISENEEGQFWEVTGSGRGNRNGPETTKIRWGGTTGLTREEAHDKAVKKDQSYWSQ